MNLYNNRPRGRLSGEDMDALVRWSLRDSVDGPAPSDAVWLRIQAQAGTRAQPPAPWSLLAELRFQLGMLVRFLVLPFADEHVVRDTQRMDVGRTPVAQSDWPWPSPLFPARQTIC
jgi:hypothetical protein